MEQLRIDRYMSGGWRPGAGRKKSETSGVSHLKRPRVTRHTPVHGTIRLVEGLPSLRVWETFLVIHQAICDARDLGKIGPDRFRVIEFSVQSNHIHWCFEAGDTASLSAGMQALSARLARRLNKHWNRTGRVFADRIHTEVVSTPTQTRNMLLYVLANARRHGAWLGTNKPDPFSSAPNFRGWMHRPSVDAKTLPPATSEPQSWLLSMGWHRNQGLLYWTDRSPEFLCQNQKAAS